MPAQGGHDGAEDMEIKIRGMILSDIEVFPREFAMQDWNKPAEQFQKYFEEQEKEIRRIFVATADRKAAGKAFRPMWRRLNCGLCIA